MTGQVFDIQKFSLHDGPGIRTTVFLKGCPLNCVSCCNPESQKFQPELSFDVSKCTNCMKCINSCPEKAIAVDSTKIKVDFGVCNTCGKCVDVCPENAFRIFGNELSAQQVLDEVVKDIAYFETSGGGITLSGGEVMAQFDFALEILQLAKNRNIHTVIETSGYSKTENFQKLLPYVDLFLIDYKHTDKQLHKQFTGVEQNLILKNLDYLYSQKAALLLRCLIIPDLNDNQKHFEGICNISSKYPELKGVEILSYHNFGASKYTKTGKKYQLESSETVSKIQRAEWIKKLNEMGCLNLINV
jgi:pyruvate formate lyase activating enzyme